MLLSPQSQLVHKFSHHSKAIAINAHDTHVAFNTGTIVLVHSLPLMERRWVTGVLCLLLVCY